MSKCRVILTEERIVNGKEAKPGLVLGEISCAAGVLPADVDKALKSGATRFEALPEKPEPKSGGK